MSNSNLTRFGTWKKPRLVVNKVLMEGRDCLDCICTNVRPTHPNGKMFKWRKIGRGWTRSSSKLWVYAPRSVANLLAIPLSDSLAIFDGVRPLLNLIESGTDFDLSRNANVRCSLLNTRCDQRQGEERKVDHQR